MYRVLVDIVSAKVKKKLTSGGNELKIDVSADLDCSMWSYTSSADASLGSAATVGIAPSVEHSTKSRGSSSQTQSRRDSASPSSSSNFHFSSNLHSPTTAGGSSNIGIAAAQSKQSGFDGSDTVIDDNHPRTSVFQFDDVNNGDDDGDSADGGGGDDDDGNGGGGGGDDDDGDGSGGSGGSKSCIVAKQPQGKCTLKPASAGVDPSASIGSASEVAVAYMHPPLQCDPIGLLKVILAIRTENGRLRKALKIAKSSSQELADLSSNYVVLVAKAICRHNWVPKTRFIHFP